MPVGAWLLDGPNGLSGWAEEYAVTSLLLFSFPSPPHLIHPHLSPSLSAEEIDFAGDDIPPQSGVRKRMKGSIHNKETHGTSNDITEKTSADKVKGPGLLERAKEEIEALVGAVHHKMEHKSSPRQKEGELHKETGTEVNNHKKTTHENETHGRSDDISEDTPVDKVKGPNVFERAKEEVEAIVEALHPKKGSDSK